MITHFSASYIVVLVIATVLTCSCKTASQNGDDKESMIGKYFVKLYYSSTSNI